MSWTGGGSAVADRPLRGGYTESGYARKKLREAERSREQSAEDREIAPIPAVVNPKRRAKAKASLKTFCMTYLSRWFYRKFGESQDEVIAEFERIIISGGVVAIAMPRGSGKTALARAAVLWAVLCHCHRFVMLIAANATMAKQLMDPVALALKTNELLLADFPEFVYPVVRTAGINQRRPLHNGKPISVQVTKTEIALAEISGHCAGAVIRCAGLLSGNIRGQTVSMPSGDSLRPSLFLADDPQTRKSAKSPKESENREAILAGDVLGMAGPGEKLSGLVPCTVIREGDMADRILDQRLNPAYHGMRYKMIEGLLPDKDLKSWWDYKAIYDEGERRKDGGAAARAEFRRNRAEISRGLKAYWPSRYEPGEVDAIQHALNRWCKNREAFHAECQNDPSAALMADDNTPSMAGLFEKFTRLGRGVLPIWTRKLVADIDVQKEILFYKVVAVGDGFRAAVVDYGTFPDQGPGYFTIKDLRLKMSQAFSATGRSGGMESAIWWGLDQLVPKLMKSWPREDGHEHRVERLGIDTGWGDSTDFLYEYCRRSPFAAILLPTKGVGITAGERPMTEWKPRDNEPRPGLHWVLSTEPTKRAVWLLRYDTNWWKTFSCNRAAASPGPGALWLFGQDASEHRLLFDHCRAETPVFTRGRDRVVWKWTCPQGVDNHWWDTLVGSMVVASVQGMALGEASQPVTPKRWTTEEIAAARGRNRRG